MPCPAAYLGFREHLRGDVDAEDGAVITDGLVECGQCAAGAAADVDGYAAGREVGLGDRGGIGGHVVPELDVPGGGANGEEGAALGEVPAGVVDQPWRDVPDHGPGQVVQVEDTSAPWPRSPWEAS